MSRDDDVEFYVSVLRVDGGRSLPDELRVELLTNATYVRTPGVWLFEGDWETALGEWIEQGHKIEDLGEVIVPTLRGRSQKFLYDLIEPLLNAERRRATTTNNKEG